MTGGPRAPRRRGWGGGRRCGGRKDTGRRIIAASATPPPNPPTRGRGAHRVCGPAFHQARPAPPLLTQLNPGAIDKRLPLLVLRVHELREARRVAADRLDAGPPDAGADPRELADPH